MHDDSHMKSLKEKVEEYTDYIKGLSTTEDVEEIIRIAKEIERKELARNKKIIDIEGGLKKIEMLFKKLSGRQDQTKDDSKQSIAPN